MKRITKAEQRVVRAAMRWFEYRKQLDPKWKLRVQLLLTMALAKACAALAASRKGKK